MLLRSASTPILKSCTYQSDLGLRFPITRPVSMSLSSSSSSPIENSTMKISRTTSETNLRQQKKRNVSQRCVTSSTVVEEEEEVGLCSGRRLMRSLGLDEGCSVGAEHSVIVGGGGVGTGGGGNGGVGGGGDGSESMHEYYQKMIRAYPCDALLLGNYAKFLKEVRGDVVKTEEYYERAILAEPNDGNVLSHYGDLIWNSHSDGPRAQTYFDQALQASSDDCYVLASYAKFLWEAGEEEEEENGISFTGKCISPSNLPQGCSPTLPLAAAP